MLKAHEQFKINHMSLKEKVEKVSFWNSDMYIHIKKGKVENGSRATDKSKYTTYVLHKYLQSAVHTILSRNTIQM
jgi:stalled ribosome rescue protein Dom34